MKEEIVYSHYKVTLDMGLPYLMGIFLPKALSVDLHNALLRVIVFLINQCNS